MPDPVSDITRELIARYFEGELTDAESLELRDQLLANPDARAVFTAYALNRRLVPTCVASHTTASSKPRGAASDSERTPGVYRLTPIALSIAAALLLTAAAVSVYLFTARPDTIDVPRPSGPTVAIVTGVNDASFESEPVNSGDSIPAQAVRITSGSIDLDFLDGSSVTLDGPAHLAVRGRDAATLNRGRVTATARPGFTVDTPRGVAVTDLGTAFRFDVADDGSTHLVVLDGSVEMTGRWFDRITLAAGESRRTNVRGDLIQEHDDGFGVWLAARHRLAQDDSVALRLDAEATRGSGVRTRGGRFAGRPAFNVETVDDQIHRAGPGETDDFTIAMWVWPDSVSGGRIRALAATDDWKPGGVHFQLNGGLLNVGVYLANPGDMANLYGDRSVERSRWQLLAVTYDRASHHLRLFVDGEPVGEKEIDAAFTPNLDHIGIGAWRPGSYDASRELDRPFDGAIDDVLILTRAMSPDEMRRLYEAGAPRTHENHE